MILQQSIKSKNKAKKDRSHSHGLMGNDSELIRSIKAQNELLERVKNLQRKLDKKAELIKKVKDGYTQDVENITK